MKLIDLIKMQSEIEYELTKKASVNFQIAIAVEDFSHGQNVQREIRNLIEEYFENYGQEERPLE